MLKKFEFEYESFQNASALAKEDFDLLEAARKATATAFAPYSNFKVGAAARLNTGEIILGSNQESASYPVGICAERALLNSIGSQFSQATIISLAVSYDAVGKALLNHCRLAVCADNLSWISRIDIKHPLELF